MKATKIAGQVNSMLDAGVNLFTKKEYPWDDCQNLSRKYFDFTSYSVIM